MAIKFLKHRIRNYEARSYRGIVIETKNEIKQAEGFFQNFLNQNIILKYREYRSLVRIAHSPNHSFGRITINDANLFGERGSFKAGEVLIFSIELIDGKPFLLLQTEDELEHEGVSRIQNKSKMNSEEFAELQKGRRKLGLEAEKFVFEYEKDYLRDAGKDCLVKHVKHVSQEDVGAGYDILSYDLQGSEKFIEAKARGYQIPEFEWTRTEHDFASKVGDQYWIYLLNKVNGKLEISHKIQNPIKKIESHDLKIEPSSYNVKIVKRGRG